MRYADLFKRTKEEPQHKLTVDDRVNTKYGQGVVVWIRGNYVSVRADNGTTYGLEKKELEQ